MQDPKPVVSVDTRRAPARFPHLGAFESTKLIGSGTDILGTTRHIERWRHDLQLLHDADVRALRYSAPWHRIEPQPGVYDFSWFDQPMRLLEKLGMDPILDPLHHVSFPCWLTDGFANPDFVEHYERFLVALARRYPWAKRYTVFNEPLPTTLHCSYMGTWYPHHRSDADFVRMAMNVVKAICRVSATLRRELPDVELVHVDTCETHRAMDARSEEWVRFANHRRFLMHDLILGQVDRHHALYSYLRIHGCSDDDLAWLSDHRTTFDLLGLDYYIHSEMEWHWDTHLDRADIHWPVENPVGFASVARDYAERFRTPVMLTETNLRGTHLDRLTWLKFMQEQSETLASDVDFRGFCWYPSIDSTDWGNLCTKATCMVDPQGIWCLDDARWHRHPSALSENYARLATGEITAADLPAYAFSGENEHNLRGYEKLLSHWPEWLEQPVEEAA